MLSAPALKNMTIRLHNHFLRAFILVLALALRTLPLTYSHFCDETVYLQHAKVILDGRTNYEESPYRPPGLPVLYAYCRGNISCTLFLL